MPSIFDQETLNFAHRGFTARAPENSLAAFRAAIELGVDGIELDVRLCKTGEIVVLHDATVTRMTYGRGFVKARSLSELKRLRLRSDHADLDEHIPTLEEVLELVDGRVLLNIEIKTKGYPRDFIENKVAGIIKRFGVEDKTIISSFNPIVIRRVKKINDRLITGYLMDKSLRVRYSEIPLSKLTRANAIHLEKSLAKDSLLKKIRDFGFYCLVWSVNEREQMQQLLDQGVQGIITDRPDLLNELKLDNRNA
ncbi:MAG: glycerophosphodiester phosphodiesterase [bacterium]